MSTRRQPSAEVTPVEAHDGLSGAIAERAGFRGVWASGLSISCALGYRDANEASWTQVVDAVERIVDSTQLPVLVDGDSGFGNFNNARRADRGHQRIAMHGAEPDVVAHQGRRRLACRSRALITTPSVAFSGSTFDHT
jgi:2-methylisocitrate lyase-like PEP mutase family enzyme